MALIAHYKLDGNAEDAIGNNHGTPNGVSWVDGKIGQAGDFSSGGTADLGVTVGYTYTIAFWFKMLTPYTGSYRKFLQQSDNRSPGFWMMSTYNGLHLRQVLSIYNNAGINTSVIPVGEWVHITFICEQTPAGVSFTNYINGVLDKTSFEIGDTVVPTGTNIQLLNNSYSMDDVRIYDHALSKREVKDLSLGLANKLPLKNDLYNIVENELATSTNYSHETWGTRFFSGDPLEIRNNPYTGSKTYYMEIEVPNVPTGVDMVLHAPFLSHSTGLQIHLVDTGNIAFTTRTSAGVYSTTASYPCPIGVKFSIAFVCTDSFSKAYINGELIGELSGAFKTDFSGEINVGARVTGGYPMEIKASNLMTFNNILSDKEIQQLHQEKANIDADGNVSSLLSEPDEILLIKEQTKNVYDNAYKSMGVWTVENPDISKFVEPNNTLGNSYVVGDVFCSSAEYYPTRFEFTKENNTKGFVNTVTPVYGSWIAGWNRVLFKVTRYSDATNTPWDSMNRLEIYRSGPATGSDTSQFITIKNLKLIKNTENIDMGPLSIKRGLNPINVSEVGVTNGLVAYYPLTKDTRDYVDTNDATNNGATLTADGYDFDGTDNLQITNVITGSHTIVTQAKLNIVPGAGSGNRKTLLRGLGGWNPGIWVSSDLLRVHALNQYRTISWNADLEWHQIGQIYNAETDELFIVLDGIIYTGSKTNGYYGVPTNLLLGAEASGSTTNWVGQMRETRIYNRALTPQEVALQAKLDLNNSNIEMTKDCIFTKGQFKEV